MTATKKSTTLSIVLLVVSVLSTLVLFIPALFLAMVSDSCSANTCNMTVFSIGFYIAVAGPAISTLLGLVFTIRALVQKKDAVNFALIGLGGTYGAFMLGVAITFIVAASKTS
ncbi:hypothetical protein [Aurantimicrobium minutum]|uniref:hypothetical protein n=1 Tax=Aurantimicrobium minutum TaxID=708131 RepID=UPI0024756DFB|nr:hypothetical protein [Aurantimicrobium minutum]MDH6423375.1 hypothetical protein [Aurantimicrobium minutum]